MVVLSSNEGTDSNCLTPLILLFQITYQEITSRQQASVLCVTLKCIRSYPCVYTIINENVKTKPNVLDLGGLFYLTVMGICK